MVAAASHVITLIENQYISNEVKVTAEEVILN